MHLYEADTAIDSSTRVIEVPNLRYDVDSLSLDFYDVDELDITGVEARSFGIGISRLDGSELAPSEEIEAPSSYLSLQDGHFHMRVKDPKAGAGISMGYQFIPSWFWAVYWLLLSVVVLSGAFLLHQLFGIMPWLRLPALSVSAVAASFLLGSWVCGSLPYTDPLYFVLNLALTFAAALMISALTVPWLGPALVELFVFGWYAINYFVILFRGKPVMPSDLAAIGTAREVAGGYSFVPSWKLVTAGIVCVAYAALLVFVGKRHHADLEGKANGGAKKTRMNIAKPRTGLMARLGLRAATIAFAVLLAFCATHNAAFDSLATFAWDPVLLENFHREGIVLTFVKSWMNSRVAEPEGYSREEVASWLSEYQSKSESDEAVEGIRPTRVIMVMDEALADLRTVGLSQEIDVMPFMDSLRENTTEGSLYVSIFGGGTCNTEFEALTGMSLSFLGVGAYPYTENVVGPTASLASYLSALGYDTTAFHANDAENWNRNKVYPLLGFSDFHALDDYEKEVVVEKLHGHPSDATDFAYIEKIDSERTSPGLLFCVTMQNHSGYEHWEDVTEDASVSEHGSSLEQDARVYLSLVRASDDAIRSLVEKYSDDPEPTMVVYFGDHQPGLPMEAREGVYTTAENMIDLYKSKFFVWTNYENEESHDTAMSANYMPWLVLSRGNFKIPPYVRMLGELHERYPVICAQGVIDSNGTLYSGVADPRIADDPLIRRYRCVQYARLFDEIDEAWFKISQ